MKKNFLLIGFFIAMITLFMGCTGINPTGTSINTTLEITTNYESWKNSDEAEDLNNDRKINEADYEIFINQSKSDYEIWKNSDDAEDLNNDQKINEADYEIFMNPVKSDYEIWKNSDDAEDLNNDRKINEADYEIFMNPVKSDYEIWKESNKSEDLNSDGEINEQDYNIYLENTEFLGNYIIHNYTFVGDEQLNIYNENINPEDLILFKDLGQYLGQIYFSVDNSGSIYASVPATMISAFGESFEIVLEGLNNMSIKRISPYLATLDTFVMLDNMKISVTLYLTDIENGFSTRYTINYGGIISTIAFDLIRAE